MARELYSVGIVGLGHVAGHHKAAIEGSDAFRLVAVCDPDESRFEGFAPGVACFTDIGGLLQAPSVDVVVVASPNRMHVRHGMDAMAAGKWVVMEKPLAESRADFERFAARRTELDGRCTLALHSAFGLDVDWFCRSMAEERLPPLTLSSFHAGFYDPYFEEGLLLDRASSLGGSWLDSGINALSVVCRLVSPERLSVTDSRMTRLAAAGCREVQGTVEFEFTRDGSHGSGTIDTNWTLGRNSKITRLGCTDGREYVLDHTAQAVLLRESGEERVLFTCDNGLPRLTNHYIGVFADLARQLRAGQDNFSYCQRLHSLFFEAEDRSP